MNSFIYFTFFIPILFFAVYYYVGKYSFATVSDYGESYVNKNETYFVAAFVMIGFITFWSAIRNGGADTNSYIRMFEDCRPSQSIIQLFRNDSDEKTPLFSAFIIALKRITSNFHVFLAIISILSGVWISYYIGKYSCDVSLSCFIFVASLNCIWMFNGIRQFLVAAVFIANIRLITEKKLGKFLIMVLILYMIHKSAIVLIPIYFISNFKNWSLPIFMCILATMIAVIVFPDRINEFLDGLDEYVVEVEDDGVNFIRVIVASVTPIIAFIFRKDIDDKNRLVNVLINMSLITVGLYALGVVTSGIMMGRLPLYTELGNVILLPYLLKRCVPQRYRNIAYLLCIFGFLGFYYLQVRDFAYTTDLFDSLNLKY